MQRLLSANDRLVVTPNVVNELRNSVGVNGVERFIAVRGITAIDAPNADAMTASYVRQQLDMLVGPERGNAGDALNLAEASSIGADIFLTLDAHTIGEAFGRGGGTVEAPGMGGLPFDIAGGDATP